MKRYIVSAMDMNRRKIKHIAEEVISEHGENNSIGKFDRFIRTMMNSWAESGEHDDEFLHEVINRAYEREFGK